MSYYNQTFTLDTFPFDDAKAVWDMEEHLYVPTNDYILKKTGLDLEEEFGSPEEANRQTIEISEKLKDIFESTANLKNLQGYIDLKEYTMAKDLKIRDRVINAIVVYIRACVITDIDAVGDEHGINFKNSTRVEIKDLDDLPLQARRKIEATGLMFRGTYDYCIDPDDYRSDY